MLVVVIIDSPVNLAGIAEGTTPLSRSVAFTSSSFLNRVLSWKCTYAYKGDSSEAILSL